MKTQIDITDRGNIAGVKVGDEVVSLRAVGQSYQVYKLYRVYKLEGWRVLVSHLDKAVSCGAWQTKDGGRCRMSMGDEYYYYSVNPAHIVAVKRRLKAQKIRQQRREDARAALMLLARPIGLELGDEWSSEDGCLRESAAYAIADKLTVEQMALLSGWLNLTN
jgi:hypothetical protein